MMSEISALAEVQPPKPLDLRFHDLPLCFEEKIVQNYLLEEAPSCAQISAHNTSLFKVDVFSPPPSQHLISATSCSLMRFTTSYQWFFFGSYDVTKGQINKHAATREECNVWLKQRVDPELGRLRKKVQESKTYVTNNTPTPTWTWNDINEVTTTNAVLSETAISFNTITGAAIHPWDNLLSCKPEKGYCLSREALYMFEPFELTCFGTQKSLAKNTTILSHSFEKHHFFQAPDIDLAFRNLMECPPRIEQCYKNKYKNVRCTQTHYVIASSDDRAVLMNMQKFSNKAKTARSYDRKTLAVSQSLTSLALELDHEVRILREEQYRLQCKNTKAILTNLKSTQYVQPSAALSLVLNREAYATMGTETIQELACVKVDAILLPSLWVGNRLASRPIFELSYQNSTRTAQFTSGKYLRWGLRNFLPRNTGFMVFKIRDRTFIFKNGSLLESNLPRIIELGLPKTELSLPLPVQDPAYLVYLLDDETPVFGMDYIHSALSALSEVTKVQMVSLGISEEELSMFHNNPTSQRQQESLLSTIANTVNPKKPTWLTTLQFLSYGWGILSSIGLVIAIINTLRYSLRQRRKTQETEICKD